MICNVVNSCKEIGRASLISFFCYCAIQFGIKGQQSPEDTLDGCERDSLADEI